MEQTEKTLPPLDLTALLGKLGPHMKRYWALGLVLVVMMAGILGFLEKKGYVPEYEASASFTVKVVNPLYAAANGYNAETAEQMERTFPYILSSNALREYVKDHLGITRLPAARAEVINGTNVFTLRVRDTDPKRAADVLHAIIECYPAVSEYVLGPTKMILLDDSGVPTRPVASQRIPMAIAMGAALGFALWLAILMMLSALRNTVNDEDELKQLLSCPCLGALPAMKVVGKNASCPMVTQEHGQRGFADAMHLVQLHLETELKKSNHKVVLISSAVPSEGKTTTAANLAITMAQKGKRVLLIDCDLRSPSVARAFGIRNEGGLLEFLDGSLSVKQLMKKTSVPNLYLITGGKTKKANIADQISGERFGKVMEAVKRFFDYIILDTSPCGMLADASELAELADCAVMVVRRDHAARSQILDGARFLTDSKLPLIGAILNGAKAKGNDNYGYGYGYGKRK